MRRPVLFAIVLFCFGFPSAVAGFDPLPEEVARFLAGKRLVGSVGFAAKSAQLTPAAKAKLREFAARIKKTANETDLLRIEGWADKGPSTSLATERARSVVQFLQEEVKVKRAIYFTGIIREKGEKGNGNRVDVVLYENTFASEEDEKEL